MAVKRKRVRRRVRRNNNNPKTHLTFDTNHPERYLETNFNGTFIGKSTGAAGTGSLGLNMATINNAASVQLGTARNNRLGTHIILTRLAIRAYVTCTFGARFRVVVFANPRDGALNNQLTNANLTAALEAPPFLRQGIYGSAVGPIDYMLDPGCSHQVLYDKMYGTGAYSQGYIGSGTITTATMPVGSQVVPLELDIPLKLPVVYGQGGAEETGDLAVLIISTCTNGNPDTASRCELFGTVRIQYVDALNFEAIGKNIRDFVDEAGNTASHVMNSKFMQFLRQAAPYVTAIWGY